VTRSQRLSVNGSIGNRRFGNGGRWSSPGVRLSYASEHQSLALLEYFVHLDKDDPPGDLVLAVAEVPNDLTRERVEVGQLATNWRDPAAPPELARIGDEFVRKGEKARWALTAEHWDESWVAVDIENHPSLYVPY